MEKKSTIQPNLTPLKAFYENLTMTEEQAFNSLSNEVFLEEMKLLEMLNDLPKISKTPSSTSVDIILRYSKKQSEKDMVFES